MDQDIILAYNNGLTTREVCQSFKIGMSKLYKIFRENSVKTRSSSESLKEHYKKNGTNKLKDETKKKLSDALKKAHREGRHDGWKAINENIKHRSYPEEFFLKVIENNQWLNKYEIVEKLPFGKYFLDFALINLKIDIEIDGNQHYTTEKAVNHDKVRNEYLISQGWKVYRICWSSFTKNIENELLELKDYLTQLDSQTSRFYTIDEVIKRKGICSVCSNETSKEGLMCKSCKDKQPRYKQRKVKRPEYKELVDEVNENGYSVTGRKYGVSDTAVRKWIKFYMR